MFILLIIVGAAWYEKTPIIARGAQNNTPVQFLFCKYIINYKIILKWKKIKRGSGCT
jgi:hypothetical protein